MARSLSAESWRWADFGGDAMLVTEGGGSKVILSARRNAIETRDADGRLVPIRGGEPVARLIAATPDLLEALALLLGEVGTAANGGHLIHTPGRNAARAALAKAVG